MAEYLFPPAPVFALSVVGQDAQIPLRRIFCVGRNYVAHAAEMGGTVDRAAPWYFTKSACHAVHGHGMLPYPPGTSDYHHEVELALAIGAPLFQATPEQAAQAIYAYGVALDMTRRDRQQEGKDHSRPWDLGKDVEGGAVFAPMTPAAQVGPLGDKRIHLQVNGVARQEARLGDMVWSCPEILAHLSGFYHLQPGDVVLTGTPAGVGAVQPGDRITGGIDGLSLIDVTLA